AEESSLVVLYKPLFSLHMLIYDTLLPQLTHLPADDRSSLLRGRHFAFIADSIIEHTPLTFVKKLGLSLPPPEKIEELKSLPYLVVSPPDDGNRIPLPGEKGAAKVRYTVNMLAPPKRRSRLGK
ncbi:uncharacterized protein K460DRAFT_255775, partial [Cucurbitaria berberidis CBS 394.84]